MMLLEEYLGLLNEQIEQESRAVAAGNAVSFEDYSKRVGKIKGMQHAHSLLVDLYKSKPGEERT